MQIRSVALLVVFATAAALLSSCAGGSGFDPWARGRVLVSGTVLFETFDPTPADGLVAAPARPVPGAVVEIGLNEFGRTQILARGNLTETGAYLLEVPANSQLKIYVKAALGAPSDPHLLIVDPDDGRKLHTATATFSTAESDLTADMTIGSGFEDGVGFDDSARSSGAFSILESIYYAEQLMRSADPTITFPDLVVNWGPQNTDGSFYLPSTREIWLAGDQMVDNDEFDRAIIVHEWGHYFEDVHSRSDSIGGPHSVEPNYNDILDDSVAWGEGWATALAGIVLDLHDVGPVAYADTRLFDGLGGYAPDTGIYIDIENSTHGNSDGYWSEVSILRLVYDLYDDTNEGAPADNLSLGFQPIYDVLVGAQRDTPAFTSIYSFLDGLKDLQDAATDTIIDDMAFAEDIIPADNPYGPPRSDPLVGADYTHYIEDLPLDGTVINVDPDDQPLATSGEHIGKYAEFWPGNKLFQRWFFRRTIAGGEEGRFKITITPTGMIDASLAGRVVVYLPEIGLYDYSAIHGEVVEISGTAQVGDSIVFAVGSYLDSNAAAETTNGETSFTVKATQPVTKPLSN
jgi:hypothetical protein